MSAPRPRSSLREWLIAAALILVVVAVRVELHLARNALTQHESAQTRAIREKLAASENASAQNAEKDLEMLQSMLKTSQNSLKLIQANPAASPEEIQRAQRRVDLIQSVIASDQKILQLQKKNIQALQSRSQGSSD